MSRIGAEPGYVVEQDDANQILQVRMFEDTPVPRTLTPATSLTLRLTNAAGGAAIYADNFFAPPTPPGSPSRITNPSVGTYQFLLGDPSRFPLTTGGPVNQETAVQNLLIATWHGVGLVGSAPATRRQLVFVVGSQSIAYVEMFRQFLDKNVKRVDLDSIRLQRLGYTDFQLMSYLSAGLTAINAYPPYPTFTSLEDWPSAFAWPLFKAGLVTGLAAQSIYAVDTDIPNWSDQGNAFVIDHYPKLAPLLTAWSTELATEIPKIKFQHFVGGPSGKVEAGPNARLNALIQMAPGGALFRGITFR